MALLQHRQRSSKLETKSQPAAEKIDVAEQATVLPSFVRLFTLDPVPPRTMTIMIQSAQPEHHATRDNVNQLVSNTRTKTAHSEDSIRQLAEGLRDSTTISTATTASIQHIEI